MSRDKILVLLRERRLCVEGGFVFDWREKLHEAESGRSRGGGRGVLG